MDISSVNAQAMNVPAALQGLQGANPNQNSKQAHQVAQQFEAILTRQFLSKTVSSMMDSDKSPGGDVYGYFLTDVLAQKMSEGSGLGLGKVLERQFTSPTAAPLSSNSLPTASK